MLSSLLWKCKEEHTDQSVLHFSCTLSLSLSLSLWKETAQKPSNVVAATSLFPSVCVIGIFCFDECFLFYVITGRQYFL